MSEEKSAKEIKEINNVVEILIASADANRAHIKMAESNTSMAGFHKRYMWVVGSVIVAQTVLGCMALYRFW